MQGPQVYQLFTFTCYSRKIKFICLSIYWNILEGIVSRNCVFKICLRQREELYAIVVSCRYDLHLLLHG